MTQNAIPDNELTALLESFPKGVVAFDLETTGLSPLIDKIIEIAAIKITPSSIEIFESLVDPQIPIPAYTTEIHGISDDMITGKPLMNTVLGEFLEFVGELPLIAHNAKFDLGFIVYEIHQQKLKVGDNKVYCSVAQARNSIDDSENYKLGTLSEHLDIDLVNHHRASDDALASLRVFAHCLLKGSGKKLRHQFEFSQFKKREDLDLPKNLNVIYQSLPEQKQILIKYKGGSMRGQWRVVQPVSVLPMPQGNILYAKCLHSDLYKSFSLKKISDAKEATSEEIQKVLKK